MFPEEERVLDPDAVVDDAAEELAELNEAAKKEELRKTVGSFMSSSMILLKLLILISSL